MPVTYSSGTSTPPGNSYTPDNVTDAALIWIAYARRPGPTDLTASGWLFGSTPMTEAPGTDQWNDIAGGGDPTAACGYLANPGTIGQVLDVTYSNLTTAEFGFAITLAGAHQTSTVSDSGGAAYGSDASPSLSYTAPDDAIVIYWRIHAQSTDTVWTDPTGFTNREDVNFVISPSFRTFAVWTKELLAGETASVSATSDSAGDGGVHGFIVVGPAPSGSTTTPQSGNATGTGTPSISIKAIYQVSGVAAGIGTADVTKKISKLFSVNTSGAPEITKKIEKSFTVNTLGTAAGQEAFVTKQSATASATGTASLATRFIEFVGRLPEVTRNLTRAITRSVTRAIERVMDR